MRSSFFGAYQFVKQNLREMGRRTFKLLTEQIEGDTAVKHVVVNGRLSVRESTIAIKN